MVKKMARVSEEGLVRYVEAFLDEYKTAVEAMLDPEVHERLLRYSLLPSRIIVYVSSSSGVAIHYVAESQETSVEAWSGPRRAEDFLFSVPDGLRQQLKFSAIGVEGRWRLTLDRMLFTNGIPLTINNEDAEIIIINTRSEIGSVTADIRYAELYGTTRASRWTEQQARIRALQEVKVALADILRSEQLSLPLTEIIQRRKEKSVLVLGSFKEAGRDRLERIRRFLVNHGYLPVLIDEYPDIPDQSLAQKVATVGLASRFVIAEDSEAAGQLYEIGAVCQANNLLTVILREQGRQASFMTRGASITSKVIAEYDYDASALEDTLDIAVEWAERTFAELGKSYGSTYPWRDPDSRGSD
jgi:hypothetical protein